MGWAVPLPAVDAVNAVAGRRGVGVRLRPLLLVANANASGVRRELVESARRALRAEGASVDVAVTASGEELTAALDTSADRRTVVVGGDGSVHLLANLSHGGEVALLPAGRANNVARSLGIPGDLRAAAALAVSGRARPLDAIEATSDERRYVAVEGISVGFLAQARSRYDAPNSAAVGTALSAGVRALGKFRPFDVVLETDEMNARLRIGQLFAANLPLYAFGLRAAPDADPYDGLVDVVALAPRGRASLLALGARVRRGTHVRSRRVRTWRTARLRLDPGGASPVVADSVNLGSGPVVLRGLPGALRVVAP